MLLRTKIGLLRAVKLHLHFYLRKIAWKEQENKRAG